MSDRAVRLAGGAGIVFVVLLLIGVFGGGSMPMADDPIDKIRSYYVDNRSAVLFTNMIGLVGIPFVLWFAVVLRDLFRGDRLGHLLGTASLVGLVATAPMAMVGGALQAAPVYVDGAAKNFGDDTLRILFIGQGLAFAATSAGITLFVLGAGLGVRRTRALPGYTMWLAFLAVVGNIVTMFSTLGAGASGLGLAGVTTFALFILVTGITMAAGKTTPVAAT
jgi:hypothetical protein